MSPLTLTTLIPVLQVAVGPVILISGVGLLLLTMTNRLGRAIDRARALASQLANMPDATRERAVVQVSILWRRARLIRHAITLASASAFFAGLLVIVLFVLALFGLEAGWLIGALFTACLLSLVGSLVVFIHDINQSLAALQVELEQVQPGITGAIASKSQNGSIG